MRYLDANVFVYAVASAGKEGDASRRVLRETASGAQPAVTAVLTLDEVVWALRREVDRETALRQTSRLLAYPNLILLDVRAKHMVAAFDLIERHTSLRPRDALHAAVAIDAGVFTIISDDPDFDTVRELTRTPLAPP